MIKHYDQITLSELVKLLEKADQSLPVTLRKNKFPDSLFSYRGFYEDLAIDGGPEMVIVGDFCAKLKAAVGTKIYGYKGGEYKVTKDTALWVAEDGELGNFVTGIRVSTSGCKIVSRKN